MILLINLRTVDVRWVDSIMFRFEISDLAVIFVSVFRIICFLQNCQITLPYIYLQIKLQFLFVGRFEINSSRDYFRENLRQKQNVREQSNVTCQLFVTSSTWKRNFNLAKHNKSREIFLCEIENLAQLFGI